MAKTYDPIIPPAKKDKMQYINDVQRRLEERATSITRNDIAHDEDSLVTTAVAAVAINKADTIVPKPFKKRQTPRQKTFGYLKGYFFRSNDKAYLDWLLLIGALFSIVAIVGLMWAFSWWFMAFWTALEIMSKPLFILCLEGFGILAGMSLVVNVFNKYCTEKLGIRFRNWLTEKLLSKYLDRESYLNMIRRGKLNAAGQRIQEDVSKFVDNTLSLFFDFVKSTLTVVVFVGTLWQLSGVLSIVLFGMSLTIPGYLVWAGILLAIVASYITHRIGKHLAKINQEQAAAEAALREPIDTIATNGENIALENGENYYKERLKILLAKVTNIANKKLKINLALIGFQSVYVDFSTIFPIILASPLYFADIIMFPQLMQIGFSFAQIQSALSFFMDSYTKYASWNASLERLIELEEALSVDLEGQNININYAENGDITIDNLVVTSPDKSQNIIYKMPQLTLFHNQNILIKGESGLGKSLTLKVIAGTWKYGEGTITLPNGKKRCFLPQTPTIPEDTLVNILKYGSNDSYTSDRCREVLKLVGLKAEHIELLENTDISWNRRLSGGEKQRIAFARILLQEPDEIYLDEATSALDVKSEEEEHAVLERTLPRSTLISVAHRDSVKKFHDKTFIFFSPGNGSKEIQIEENDNDSGEIFDEELGTPPAYTGTSPFGTH